MRTVGSTITLLLVYRAGAPRAAGAEGKMAKKWAEARRQGTVFSDRYAGEMSEAIFQRGSCHGAGEGRGEEGWKGGRGMNTFSVSTGRTFPPVLRVV